jgi:hypothetical protein
MAWFDAHLRSPPSFVKPRRGVPRSKAISWFKDRARTHISQLRKIIAVLEAHGLSVDKVRTEKPGYLVYEDAYQVWAVPFTETTT